MWGRQEVEDIMRQRRGIHPSDAFTGSQQKIAGGGKGGETIEMSICRDKALRGIEIIDDERGERCEGVRERLADENQMSMPFDALQDIYSHVCSFAIGQGDPGPVNTGRLVGGGMFLIEPVEAFVAESIVMSVAGVGDMVNDGIEMISRLYIPEDAMYEAMQAVSVGDDP